jgi:hypothetical protein
MVAERFYYELALTAPSTLPGIINETRRNYVRDMRKLLHDIRPPKILFWFSQRTPDYHESYELPLWNILRGFPQLVNRPVIEQIKPAADSYVECVTRRGMPQPLFDRTGSPTTLLVDDQTGSNGLRETHNRYYPSPEMHVDAAAALEPTCRDLLRPKGMLRPRPAPPVNNQK